MLTYADEVLTGRMKKLCECVTVSHGHVCFPFLQEPGTAEEIKAFAAGYGVEFDMFGKIDVNGSDTHPLYKFLKSRLRGSLGSFIKWNFSKFLCDTNGVPVKRYMPNTAPMDIVPDILELLPAQKNRL